MGTWNHLKLLLWKDFLIRKRNYGEQILLFGWAIGVFLVLYSVRATVHPYFQNECHYKARALPSNGLLPFVQSFICNIDNKCESLSEYEEIPSYKNSKLTDILNNIQSTLKNETAQKTIEHLPQMAKLVSTVLNGINEGGIQQFLGPGIKISDIFKDPSPLKEILGNDLSDENFKTLLNARIKFSEIFNFFNSSTTNLEKCDSKMIDNYLIVPDGANLEEISKKICDIKIEKVPKLLKILFKEANFDYIFGMLGDLLSNFQNYNLFEDLSNIVQTILNLDSVDKIVPQDLKLKEWVPKIISNLDFSSTFYIENFVKQSLEDLEPIFKDKKEWTNVKKLFMNFLDDNFQEGDHEVILENFEKDTKGKIDEKYLRIIKSFFYLLFEFSNTRDPNHILRAAKFMDFLSTIPTTELGNIAVSKMWVRISSCNDEKCQNFWLDWVISTLKYLSASLDLSTRSIKTYFENISQKNIDIFTLAGFEKNSGPYRIFQKLPELLKIFVETYRNQSFEEKITKILQTDKFTCKDIFRNLVFPQNSNISISQDEIQDFLSYFCISVFNYPILKENIFLTTISELQNFYLETPIGKLNCSFVEIVENINSIQGSVNKLSRNGLDVQEFFQENWKSRMFGYLEEFSKMRFDENTTLNRYFKFLPKQITQIIFDYQNFPILTSYVTETFQNLSNVNPDNFNPDVKQLITLSKDHPIEISILISEAILEKNYSTYFTDFCEGKNLGYRSNLNKYSKHFGAKFCQINFKNLELIFQKLNVELPKNDFIIEDFVKYFIKMLLESQKAEPNFNLSPSGNLKILNLTSVPDGKDIPKVVEEETRYIFSKYNPLEIRILENQLRIRTLLLKLLRGGNFWPQMVEEVSYPSKWALEIFEKLPFLPLDLLKMVTGSGTLYEIVSKTVLGNQNICEIDVSGLESENILVKIQKFGCVLYQISNKNYSWAVRGQPEVKSDSGMDEVDTFGQNLEKYLVAMEDFEKKGTEPLVVPNFLEPEFLKTQYVEHIEVLKQPFTILQSFSTTLNTIIDIASIYYKNGTNCSWCDYGTKILKELNKNLGKSKNYVQLTCEVGNKNNSEIIETLLHEFGWENFKTLDQPKKLKYNIEDFDRELRKVVNVISRQMIIFAANSSLQNQTEICFKNLTKLDSLKNITTYIDFLSKFLTKMDVSPPKMAEVVSNIQIYRPLAEFVDVIKMADNYQLTSEIRNELLRSNINLNELLDLKKTKNLEVSSLKKIFQNLNLTKLVGEKHNLTFLHDILDHIDTKLLNRTITNLHYVSLNDSIFVQNVYGDLENLIWSLGDIVDFVIKNNFNEIFNGSYNISNLLKGALKLVKRRSVDVFFDSLKSLLEAVTPKILPKVIKNDLEQVFQSLESMELFRKLNLLRKTYNVSEVFLRTKPFEEYLVRNLGFGTELAGDILGSKLDLYELVSQQSNGANLTCNQETLEKYLDFDSKVGAGSISEVICHLNLSVLEKNGAGLLKSFDLNHILDQVINTAFKNIVERSNLDQGEAQETLDNLPNGISLLSSFQVEKLTQNFSFDEVDLQNISPDLLQKSSDLLCGRSMELSSNKFIQILLDVEDFQKNDDSERKSMGSLFCQSIYESIIKMGGGKIVWTYVKPFLRGKILYTPDTPETRRIVKEANFTFVEMDNFKRVLRNLGEGLSKLNFGNRSTNGGNDFLETPVSKILIQTVLEHFNISNFALDSNLMGSFDSLGSIQSILRALYNLVDCVRIDRFEGVENEAQLEISAKKLMKTNEFVAGLVFDQLEGNRQFPSNLSYKIRMDIEAVPSTNNLKYYFWTPGPDDNFLLDLRYFRSFIQLQDMVDSAILKLQGVKTLRKTYTQQMPYPCWTDDYFLTGMSVSQTFQVCFFFAFIVLIGTAVRYFVLEKESGNSILMNIMGLKYHVYSLSWFLITFLQMVFLVVFIVVIVKVSHVLPKTDSALLFFFLIEFGFTSIMFTYLVASFFNSASLGGVASVIFYLLTFMPYIIIISLESTIIFPLRMIAKLLMSTSFSYGCLLMIRFEVQGVGLQWSNIWQTPLRDDPMAFGHTLIFLLLDAIIYGTLGYFISRRAYGKNHLKHTLSSDSSNNLKAAVSIRGLTKIYNADKKNIRAIDNIEMDLHTGQVTTLLGHNGAGKTTLIKILTGMMVPTEGDIAINDDMTGQYLGVCAQKSILIENLTPREHLFFYARLKSGFGYADVFVEVIEMVESVGLGPLVNELVRNLSEGMRRRLCVAIAFLGKPKLVILDEPSSGVDPIARRQIWELILKHKEGRTVLLSTHYLDEAELLSDHIVILHKGKIICKGTPLELKHNYGKGYDICFEFHSTNEDLAKSLLNTVKNVSYNASLTQITPKRITITAPFKSSTGETTNFQHLTQILEDHQLKFGFINYSMNCSTLEDVFLDLCKVSEKTSEPVSSFYNEIVPEKIVPVEKADLSYLTTDGKMSGSTFQKAFALLRKRFIHFWLDWRLILCALVLPTVFTAIAMGFSLIRPPILDNPPLKLNPDLYKDGTTSFLKVPFPSGSSILKRGSSYSSQDYLQKEDSLLESGSSGLGVVSKIIELYDKEILQYQNESLNCQCSQGRQTCSGRTQIVLDTLLGFSGINETVQWLLDTQEDYIERRYGGFSNSKDENFVVWYNNKGFHSMPSYLNLLNNAILRNSGVKGSITTYSHPIKLSPSQLNYSTVGQHIADIGIAAILLVAFTLVLASNSMFLVQERVNEEKRLQFLSGVSPSMYWVISTIWDFSVLILALILAVGVFEVFGLPIYVGRENLQAVILLTIIYGWATIPFYHLAEKFFQDASMANVILFCAYWFVGIAQMTCVLLIDIIGSSDLSSQIRNILYEFYLIFPPFAFLDGLVQVSKNSIQAELLQRFQMDTYVTPISWQLLGKHFLWMVLLGSLFFTLNLFVENRWIIFWRKKDSNPNFSDNYNSYAVEIVDLKKIYNGNTGKKVAVDGINLKVPRGQCVGLIGVNGAGKSTTFKILTTEISPTQGQVYVEGRKIGNRPLFTGEMSYCPQCDALDPKLTVKQTLEFYCQLRGTENSKKVVEKVLHSFELKKYQNRKCEFLSGGNKRKLCTAVASLGRSSIILMDEPTSGMDPHSKAITGNLIKNLLKLNKSVILTSHSVEDCENLCSTVVILIDGKIVCQGTPKELKEKYENGYILSIRISEQNDQNKMEKFILENFPKSILYNRQYCTSQFLIYTENILISEIFSKINELSNNLIIKDFSLVQSSLDQVFVNIAKRSKENLDLIESTPNNFLMSIM